MEKDKASRYGLYIGTFVTSFLFAFILWIASLIFIAIYSNFAFGNYVLLFLILPAWIVILYYPVYSRLKRRR